MYVVRCAGTLVMACCLSGCAPSVPGERIGAYRITMTLVENTCGPTAVFLEDGKRYSAELRADSNDTGYWRVPGQPVLRGSYDSGKFTFKFAEIAATSTADAGNACQIEQQALLEGELSDPPSDAGTLAASTEAGAGDAALATSESWLKAKYTLSLAAVAGTDCSEALSPVGAYAALPCTVRYEMVGEPREPL